MIHRNCGRPLTSATPPICCLSRNSLQTVIHSSQRWFRMQKSEMASNLMHNCALHCTHFKHNWTTCYLYWRCNGKVGWFWKCICIAINSIHIPVYCAAPDGCCMGEQIIWNDEAGGEILAHCKHCFRSEHTVNTRQCSLTRDEPQH